MPVPRHNLFRLRQQIKQVIFRVWLCTRLKKSSLVFHFQKMKWSTPRELINKSDELLEKSTRSRENRRCNLRQWVDWALICRVPGFGFSSSMCFVRNQPENQQAFSLVPLCLNPSKKKIKTCVIEHFSRTIMSNLMSRSVFLWRELSTMFVHLDPFCGLVLFQKQKPTSIWEIFQKQMFTCNSNWTRIALLCRFVEILSVCTQVCFHCCNLSPFERDKKVSEKYPCWSVLRAFWSTSSQWFADSFDVEIWCYNTCAICFNWKCFVGVGVIKCPSRETASPCIFSMAVESKWHRGSLPWRENAPAQIWLPPNGRGIFPLGGGTLTQFVYPKGWLCHSVTVWGHFAMGKAQRGRCAILWWDGGILPREKHNC